ncbi:MAG: TPM domain-containing protein, partial [Vicinamibacterales bacterium]
MINRPNHPSLHALLALVCLVASIALWVGTAAAQPAPPQLTGTVNDFANVVDEASERELDRRIRSLQAATGDVIVVATVPALEGYADINEFAVKLFENGGRGIGQKGKDNGALIVLALKEKEARIEVGYDLEEFITDGYAGETIRQVMVPEFRKGEYGRGLVAGATRLINRVAERRGVELQDVPRERQPIQAPPTFKALPVIVFILIFLFVMSNRRGGRRRRHWGGWNSGVGPFGGGLGGG